MNDSENKLKPISRGKVFGIGALGTGVLCALIAVCVPPKPALVAEQAKPQRVEELNAGASAAASVAVSTAATAGQGKEIYERYCTGCHGDDGKAQTNFGRMMKPTPTNFYDGPWRGEQSEEAVIAAVTQGLGAMPAYKNEITAETDLAALAKYVLSLRKAVSP